MKYVSTRLAPAVILATASSAIAGQFPTIDPNYSQQIYTAPLYTTTIPHEGGFAWTSGGNLLTRTGAVVNEYSLTPNTIVNSTSVRSTIANVAVPGLNSTGVGMTNGLDGWVYTATGSGLQRFNPNNLAAPAQNLTGTVGGNGWGITTLPDGRIAYSDGGFPSNVYVYTPNANPNLGTNTLIATIDNTLNTSVAATLVDGLVAGPGGQIAVAGQNNQSITIISSSGGFINTFSTAHYPDGLAFSSPTASATTIYSNNNDGTVTRYVLGPGYTGVPVATDIAGISGAYGDLAAVGPDCAFYVSQYENGSYHGSVAGVGTHWDDNTTTSDSTYTRIALLSFGPGGEVIEDCGFYTPLETSVPEPASLPLLALASLPLLLGRKRRPRVAC